MSRYRFLLWPLAFAWAAWIGYLELHTDEVQGLLLILLSGAFLLGLVHPRGAWLWGILLGGSVFAAHILARALGWPEAVPPEPNVWATLSVVLFGLAGAYAGVAARWAIGKFYQPKLNH